jgi:phosphoribosyl 1,2-cyclic phosphate phosphodiesterase
LKITFLGTGTSQGVPVIGCSCEGCRSEDEHDKRLRSSILIEDAGLTVVVDTGPDFRQQMLHAGVHRLNAVLFTHEHRDHIAGLDDIRAFNFIQKSSMDVYAEPRVIRALKAMFPYIFAEKKYPGVPQVELHALTLEAFSIGPLTFHPIRLMHHRLPVLGFRVGDFAYLTDANYISKEEKGKLRGLKYLVVNALRREPHLSHYNVAQAVALIQELEPGRAFLTHLSHQIGPSSSLEKELPAHIKPAYDGLVLDI